MRTLNSFSDFRQVFVGEDQTNVALDVWEDLLDGVIRARTEEVVEDLADQGVLSHQNVGKIVLAFATHTKTDLLDLVRSDVVDLHQHDLGVGFNPFLKFGEVSFLLFLGERHFVD